MSLTIAHKFVSNKVEQTDTTIVGPNEWNANHSVTDTAYTPSDTYNFAAQTPNISLTSGQSATITLSPVPLGVNGSDSNHYLYISGGTGTAEAVLITGGTAISGATSGTIIFTPANSHSGSWTVTSATAGIQEAINYIGAVTRACIKIPSGSQYIYATITCNNSYIDFEGCGENATLVRAEFAAGDVLYINNAADGNVNVSNMRFVNDVSRTSGAYLHIKSTTAVYLHKIRTFGGYIGIELESVTNTMGQNVETIGYSLYGIWIKSGTTTVGAQLTNLGFGGGTDLVNSVGLLLQGDTGGAISTVEVNNFGAQTGAYAISLFANGGAVNECIFNNGILDSMSIRHINFSTAGSGSGNGIVFNNLRYGGSPSSQLAQVVNGFTNVVFNNITGSTAGGVGINLKGCANVTINNMQHGGSGNSLDIGVQLIDTVGDGSGTVCNLITIRGCHLGYTEAGATSGNVCTYGIAISSAAHTKILIEGNHCYGSTYGLYWNATSSATGNVVNNRFEGGTSGVSFTNNPASPSIVQNNTGISDIIASVASASTLAFPINPIVEITGTTGVTAISGLWKGATGIFMTTGGSVSFTSGTTIGVSVTTTQNIPYVWFFDGTKLWIR